MSRKWTNKKVHFTIWISDTMRETNMKHFHLSQILPEWLHQPSVLESYYPWIYLVFFFFNLFILNLFSSLWSITIFRLFKVNNNSYCILLYC